MHTKQWLGQKLAAGDETPPAWARSASDAPVVSPPGHRREKVCRPNPIIGAALPQPPATTICDARTIGVIAPTGPPRRSACLFGQVLLASQPLASHNKMMNATLARLEEIFRAVLLDDTLTLTPETSGKDFEAWDSLTHVTVMVHAERAFHIQFTSSEISGWQNAGELVQLIEDRLRQKG